jgi:hypothetical protein
VKDESPDGRSARYRRTSAPGSVTQNTGGRDDLKSTNHKRRR